VDESTSFNVIRLSQILNYIVHNMKYVQLLLNISRYEEKTEFFELNKKYFTLL
jgi:hypothetical protein